MRIPLSSEQKEKVLEMFRYYYSNEIDNKAMYLLPDIDENGMLEYSSQKPAIHWYEFVTNILVKKITENKFYWVNVYLTTCIQYYNPTHIHPVDFAYEKFILVINNESLFKRTENEYVVEKEQKEANREAKKKKGRSKAIKPIVSENEAENEENSKNLIKKSDFL